jgi:Ca2+-binding RTX toxin-like protein
MTTFTVDTLSDDPSTGLTLREALAEADAFSGADTILFAPAIQGGTIALAAGQLIADSDVTIDGGSGVTIDARGDSRVLLVQSGSSADHNKLTLDGITVTGGSLTTGIMRGGGVYADRFADLVLVDSTVSGNRVAAPAGTGYAAQGGGIFAFNTVTLTASTITGNSATANGATGGGIVASTVTLTNSTVSGNSVEGPLSYGGGIFAYAALTLSDSTVSGNSAAGLGGSQGGGIASRGGIVLSNSIVAGNSVAGTSSSGPDVGGTVTDSNGHNIFGSTVAGAAAGDLQTVAPTLLFAALDPVSGGGQLADNGGPTETIALRDALNNPALGGALPIAELDTDQRGDPRPSGPGTRPDVGAFELQQTRILGTNQADRLHGTAGDDVIRGLRGDDRLFGDGGDDVLRGGAGADRLRGDAGADRFVIARAEHALAEGPRRETILDFSRREGDRIDLRQIDTHEGRPGDRDFEFIRGRFTEAGQLRVDSFDGDFLVTGSTDADAAAEFAFVVRTDLASLRAADFLL